MLVELFRQDCIGYRILPVSGWTELARINDQVIEGNQEVGPPDPPLVVLSTDTLKGDAITSSFGQSC